MRFAQDSASAVLRSTWLKTLALAVLATVTVSWFLANEPTKATGVDSATTLQTVLTSSHRSEQNRARDADRHPLQTLEFFGLRSDMTVVELWPGSGWYTEILAPFLVQKGQLIVSNFDPTKNKAAKAFQDKLKANPAVFSKVKVAQINPPNELTLAPDSSVDMILTFRNIHNWVIAGYADKVYAAAYI